MRVATGIILAAWLLFMLYSFSTIQPAGYEGEVTRIISGGIIFLQFIAWAFIFMLPLTTVIILAIVEALLVLLLITYDSTYFLFTIINLIFLIMSFAAFQELKKKKNSSKKHSKNK